MTALGYSRNTVQFRHVAERVPIAFLPRDTDAARTALGIDDYEQARRACVEKDEWKLKKEAAHATEEKQG